MKKTRKGILLALLFLLFGSVTLTSCDLGGSGGGSGNIEDKDLEKYKEDAILTTNSSFIKSNYDTAEAASLEEYLDELTTAVNNATTRTEIDNSLNSFNTKANQLITKDQKQLAEAKVNAKSTLDSYVNLSDYSASNQSVINTLLVNAKANIDSATSTSDINSIVSDCKGEIDKVVTLAEETELSNYKTNKKSEIESYKTLSNYRNAEQDTLNGYINSCKSEIDAATSKAEIDEALTKYKNLMDKVKTDAELTKEETTYDDRTFSIYAINDFHGAILENGSEQGILKVGSYLKAKGKKDNTLLINSGDLFQGAIESNYNRGELLAKIQNDIQFDCMTIGNHEFDWGTTYIQKNANLKDETTNYSTPYLGANIYYCDESFNATTQASDICQEYVIKELENDIKVGIIGVIGEDQITSISANYVKNITFIDPTPVVKSLSDKLRTEEDCDIIIVDAHANVPQAVSGNASGSTSSDSEGWSSVSSVSGKKYADIVLCAHSHAYEDYTFNGTPYIQASCNGKAIANIEVKYTKDNEVEIVSKTNKLTTGEVEIDSNIQSLYNTYKAQSDEAGNEKLNTLTGSYLNQYCDTTNTGTIPNLICKSMAYYCKEKGIDVDYAICNQGRANIQLGSVTYANLFKAIPFDNEVYVIEVKGYQIKNNISSNAIYSFNTDAIENNTYYKVATLDYLANHTNNSRVLNYYSTQKAEKTVLDLNYRDITAWFVRKLKTFNGNDYKTSNNNRYQLQTSTTSYTYTDDTPIFDDGSSTGEESTVNPITIAELNANFDSLAKGESKEFSPCVYVEGTIDSIASTTYGNMTIKDDTGSVYIYGLYDINGTTRYNSLSTKPVVGDKIVIAVDTIKLYNTTEEIISAILYSINGDICE